jgi:hypothetical protein
MAYSHCSSYVVMIAMGFFLSCTTNPRNDASLPTIVNPVFIVCEGSYGSANASLSILDTTQNDTTYNDVFRKINGRDLGDDAHSMTVVDSLGFIGVTNSNRIEVINTRTFESITTVENIASPRNIACTGGKLYVTSFGDSSVIVLGPAYDVLAKIKLDHRPDEITIQNNKAYISNAMSSKKIGINDSTISIIDLNTNLVIKHLIVGKNPISLTSEPLHNSIFIACAGSGSTKGFVAVVSSTTDQISAVLDSGTSVFPVRIAVGDSLLAYILGDNGAIRVRNLSAHTFFDISGNFYSLAVGNGELFAADGQDFMSHGLLRWFNTAGKERNNFSVGQSPSAIIFSH